MARPNRTQLAAWRALLEAHAGVTASLESDLRTERGLPLAWFDVLSELSESPRGRLRMSDLAHNVLLSKSGLTRLADRMEEAGLIRREPIAEDGRGLLAALTPAGRAALRRAAPVHVRGIERYFARHLSDAEARALEATLRKLTRDR